MDIKVKNKVAELQQAMQQEEQQVSLADPVAKMMLVAMAHQSCQIERKIDRTVDRLAAKFRDEVLRGSDMRAQPAVCVARIGNGRESAPYCIDERDVFAFKPTKCDYRPIFRTRILPGRLVACFMQDVLLQPSGARTRATWPDARHHDELWLAFEPQGEVNSLEDVAIAFSHPLPAGRVVAEVGDVSIPLTPLMDDTPRTLGGNFMLTEFWKRSLVCYGLWLYRFGGCPDRRLLHRTEIPAWIRDAYDADILEPFVGNRYLWIRIKADAPCRLPMDTAMLLNCVPIVNYDIRDVKLNYSEPIQGLENDKLGVFFIGEMQNQEQAHEYFIRDFDVTQYDNERIREEVTSLYRHYVNDYFAFVDSNALHDGATLRSLRQSMMAVYDSLDEYRQGNLRPYGGVYAIRNPRNNQQPVVLTYFTTNGERGNRLRAGDRLASTNAAVGEVEALIDAVGGRDKVRDAQTRMQLAQYMVTTNDRLYTRMDIMQYCRLEFMRAFGEDAMRYCRIGIDEGNVPAGNHVEKCLAIHFSINSDSLREAVQASDFFRYLEVNIGLRKSFGWSVKIGE